MAIAYLGYAVVEDYGGSMSQSVTVPANTDYAILFVGGWNNPARTVSSMSLGGTNATNLYTRATTNSYQDSYVYGVATSSGSKTFAATFSGSFAEGGVAIIVFLGGVDSANPLVATNYAETEITVLASTTWTDMTSVADGIGLVFATAYTGTGLVPTSQSQTQIVSSTYSSDGYIAGYKLTTSAATTLGISTNGNQNYWGAVAVTLRPSTGGGGPTGLPRRALDGPFYGSIRGSVQ